PRAALLAESSPERRGRVAPRLVAAGRVADSPTELSARARGRTPQRIPGIGMTPPAQSERLRPYLAGSIFGSWAAAIAVAPSLAVKAALAAPAAAIPLAWWTLLRPGRWIALFLATALLLPPLPVALGDSGPHVSLVFAALGLLAVAIRGPEWRIDLSGPGAPLLSLFVVLLASVAPAMWHSGAAIGLGSLARVLLFGISVLMFFSPRGGAIGLRPLYWIAVASAAFACIDF